MVSLNNGLKPGGGETRSGIEKRCSHNLQSGHPAWWSAGNRCFSHTKYFDKLEANRPKKIIEKIISCIFVFLAYRICLLVLKSRGETKPQFMLTIVLNLNQQQHARSIYRLHRFCRARTSKDYGNYDADKKYWKKSQIYRK